MFKSLCAVAFSLSLISCGGSDNDPKPSISLAKAYEKEFEDSSCKPLNVTYELEIKELTNAGVDIRAKSCGSDPAIVITTACGGNRTSYLLIDIPQDQKTRAKSLGYKDTSEFPPLRTYAC